MTTAFADGKRSVHMSLSVDVDRFSDAYLRKNLVGVLKHDDGRVVQVPGELRTMCFDFRNRGFEVFPPCDNVDDQGHCQGHPMEQEQDDDC